MRVYFALGRSPVEANYVVVAICLFSDVASILIDNPL